MVLGERIEFHWSWIKAISSATGGVRWIAGSTVLMDIEQSFFCPTVYYGLALGGSLRPEKHDGAGKRLVLAWKCVPVETDALAEGGVMRMLAYTRSILTRWGLLTLCFAGVYGSGPRFGCASSMGGDGQYA